MNLIFIYGPPAAGKLTVAEKVQEITGYRILENNLTNVAALALFPFGSPSFGKIVEELRLSLFKEAVSGSVNMIFTFVYALGRDDGFVKKIVDLVESGNGHVYFVRLFCPREVLLGRVSNASRQHRPKITSPDKLQGLLEENNLLSSIPFVESLYLDTSSQGPEESAINIIAHYRL